ncbi:hypothetical protein ASPFODRAFT_201077 [Aspergillus luchuensis CBS 106.47]|uniref:PNPLA domain-containing protein n=1 Tax=Aspergillus luchuensis (strain CBS 106.47) TaxID=1137211 RepID=A0A1M3SZS3_ASPLC|nr:hypothetical protein ASPFODRAFT_201077 [Aspergillus luchuensis CBS 106.47]
MNEIVQDMSHPATQYPSLISFVGNHNRMLALRSLFPHNNILRRSSAGVIRLHLSITTAHTEYPIWFAESRLQDLPVVGECSKAPWKDGIHRYSIDGTRIPTTDLRGSLLTRLVFPWMHVVCFFVDGLAELERTKSLLEASQSRIQAGAFFAPVRMRVILVLTRPTAVYETDPVEVLRAVRGVTGPDQESLSVVDLRDRHQLSVVLALDGGGIRGMVTLGLLRALEQRLAGATTLPEIPDLTAGTSVAGSVIGTDQVYNNTSAADACRRFPDLAQCIFQPGCSLSRIWPWLSCVLNLVRDGAYDSGALERTLQQVCQPGRRVFDVMPPVAAGRRLAIVASRTSDGKPVVFPNYSGVRHRAVDSAYQRIVSHGASQNPLLRKAFFRSKHLPEIGVLQDGGVRANNPHGIAQEECRIIWPSAQTHDLLVSVGTGYVPPAEEGTDPAQHGCSSLQDKAPFRLWRAYNSSPCMDGVEAFKEGINHVPHPLRTRIFRLDHALADLPRLDDVMRVAELAILPSPASECCSIVEPDYLCSVGHIVSNWSKCISGVSKASSVGVLDHGGQHSNRSVAGQRDRTGVRPLVRECYWWPSYNLDCGY